MAMPSLEQLYDAVTRATARRDETQAAHDASRAELVRLRREYETAASNSDDEKADVLITELRTRCRTSAHAQTRVRLAEGALAKAWEAVRAALPKEKRPVVVPPPRCALCGFPRGDKHQDALCLGDRFEAAARAERMAAHAARGTRPTTFCGCGTPRHVGRCDDAVRAEAEGRRVNTW